MIEEPKNEPIKSYLKGSKEREEVEKEVKRMKGEEKEVSLVIGGKEVKTGIVDPIICPHNKHLKLGFYHNATEKELKEAIEAAKQGKREWESLKWEQRASIFLKLAEMISQEKWRARLCGATIVGQSKNFFQAEIDAACETIDFLRFNTFFAQQIFERQPKSEKGVWNRIEHRGLEGFVYAISPFNFTAIASNLNLAPVLMGNATLWKPSENAVLSASYLMDLFREVGFPAGLINFVPNRPQQMTPFLLSQPTLAGIHYTGSSAVFNMLFELVGKNMSLYKSYPRIVGETGGKGFMLVHPSSKNQIQEISTAIVRGAFEYAGQKCSALSRVYVPSSLWPSIRDSVFSFLSQVKMGNPEDPSVLVNAVISKKSFDRCNSYIQHAKTTDCCKVIYGGKSDESEGFFVEPTIILTTNPQAKSLREEIFGPVLTIYVYPDEKLDETIELVDNTSPYSLTGCIFASDRQAVQKLEEKLSYSSGNFYINDKPTGAVVGQQPFGGSRSSGTNDKAGSEINLYRWSSARTIKETFTPPTNPFYPYMN